MKGIVICIVGTILVLVFAHPTRWARMVNPTNRLTVTQVQNIARALTGGVPPGVPIIVLGSARSPESTALYSQLQGLRLRFNAVDILDNPQVAPVMNEIGHQTMPTTIVGTHIVDGPDAEAIKSAYLEEQKSNSWPAIYGSPAGSHPHAIHGSRGKVSSHSARHHTSSTK